MASRATSKDVKIPKPERLHGRHVLNRYEDGMEKCIGCELCAGVCPARCIYVRGADNPPDDPVSPGERYGYVYEINYLRCIHCDLCVEACPTEAITESKLFEFSFTNRRDAIYTKAELLVDDDGRPQQLPVGGLARGRRRRTPRAGCGPPRRPATPRSRARWPGRASSATACGPPRPASRCPATRAKLEALLAQAKERLSPYQAAKEQSEQDAAHPDHGEPWGPRVIDTIVFIVAAAMVVAGALGVVLRSNPVHCALSLVLTLFGVAVLFVTLQANFLAAVQVIVYAGAIVVLFLFVIMLLGVDRTEDLEVEPLAGQRILAAVFGIGGARPHPARPSSAARR